MAMKNKGMVLLMVLAVLTLLCLLGLMFVLMANMERATARAYLDMIRAKMIAQSGIHAAMVNTRSLLTEKGFDIKEMEYYGEDLNGDGAITTGLEDYENQDNDNRLQILDCPLYRVVHPSFMVDLNHDGVLDKQDLINMDGKKVGVSGIMPGPYDSTLGAYHVIRVEDLSGKIHINHVLPEWKNSKSSNYSEYQMLRRVLENLTYELFGKKAIGNYLVEEAPYTSPDEINTKLKKHNSSLSEADLARLKSCITVHAWRDPGVIKPVDLLKGRIGMGPGIPTLPGDNIFAWRVIRPLTIEYPDTVLYGGKRQIIGRAPVNINTAPEPVLVALLNGLAGLYLDEVAYFQPVGHYDILKISYNEAAAEAKLRGSLGVFSYTPEITREQALQIAQAFIANRTIVPDPARPWRGTFRSWQQFGLFCDKVLVEGLDHNIPAGFLSPQQADVLKANFNPNSNLPEFNPPAQRLFWVGKDNLWKAKLNKYGKSELSGGHSFEFTFFPTGYFLISSLGRLLGPDHSVLSESEIQSEVKLFSLYRETSQKDFLEDFWTRRAALNEVISLNTGDSMQTTHDGLTLQSYPEVVEYDSYGGAGYCRGPDLKRSFNLRNPYIQDAHYDGYITLATVENSDTNPEPDCRVSYNKNGLNSDGAKSIMCEPDICGPYRNRLVAPPDCTSSELDTLRLPSAGDAGPGTLFPDGVYSERDGVPGYDYKPADLDRMVVSMWVKPHFFPQAASKNRTFLTYQIFGSGVPSQYAGLYFENVFPLGIYSIVNDIEGSWNTAAGYEYCPKYDNASFLACGGGTHGTNYSWGGGIITPCLNHIGRLPSLTPPGPVHDHPVSEGEKYLTAFNHDYPSIFQAGKWLHLAWVHQTGTGGEGFGPVGDYVQPGPEAHYDVLWVNGIKCYGLLSDIICHNGTNAKYLNLYYDSENKLRLGERSSAPWLNSAPDATLDEVCIWEGVKLNLTAPGTNSANTGAEPVLIDHVWKQGRYYRGNDGAFTSRVINLAQQMNLPTGTPMTVFMVNWTQYVPEQRWTQPNYDQGRWWLLPDPSGYSKPPTCDIEILEAESKGLRGIRKSDPNKTPDPSGELIKDTYTGGKLVVTEPIRYRVLFKPNLPEPVMNNILIDPLIFDDITIIYYSVPKFLSWAYRR